METARANPGGGSARQFDAEPRPNLPCAPAGCVLVTRAARVRCSSPPYRQRLTRQARRSAIRVPITSSSKHRKCMESMQFSIVTISDGEKANPSPIVIRKMGVLPQYS